MRAILALLVLLAQTEREPKTGIERLRDNIAQRVYDTTARTQLTAQFREAIDTYKSGSLPELKPAWGEFVAPDGITFIALQLGIPSAISIPPGERVTLFGRLVDASNKFAATYNEQVAVNASKSDFYVEKSLVVPLQKSTATFGIARRGEILAMTRVDLDPEDLTAKAPGVSRLILSRDVHSLPAAQNALDPFAFGGTKVVPKPGASFQKEDEVWLFVEVRNPSLAAEGVPHISTKTTLDGPAKVPGTFIGAEATPLKGMPGRFGIGNPIDISKLPAGDYTVRIVVFDLLAKQTFRREAVIHIVD